MVIPLGEGLETPTEPHHTPSLELQHTSPTTHSSPTLPPVTTAPIPTVTPSDTPPLRQYTRRARIAQSLALPPVADEPASPLRDELTDLCTSMQRQQLDLVSKWFYSHCWSPAAEVPIGSDVVPTAGLIFATATVVTPYTRRKGKEKMIESETPKKKKIQEQMDIQMARQLEEEMEREAQRMNEQIARDAKIARIHAEEELQIMIDGLDMSNETVAKYLQEYHQFATELPFERRIELISDLVRYQDNYAKEEAKRFKRKGIRFEQESVKKLKTSKEVKASEEVPKEKVKEMMQLVPIEEVYVEALQVKHPIIDWKLWALVKETLNIRPVLSEKEMELWVELKRLEGLPSEEGSGDCDDLLQASSRKLLLDVMELPLPGEVPTTSEENLHCQKKTDATAHKIALLLKSSSNCQLKSYDSYANFDLLKNNIQAQQKKKMVKTSLSLENEPCCSKACKKNTKTLNCKITDLTDKLSDAKNMIYHNKLALEQVEARLVELRSQELKYCEKIRVLEFKTESRANSSKDLDNLLESQRLDKNKEGLRYSVVPPPPTQIYSPPKKDMSWTGLPECADDIVTDYSRPVPTIESSSYNAQNRNPSVTKTGALPSTISPKPFIKFVKAGNRPTEDKTDKVETTKKPTVKYAELYRRTSKCSKRVKLLEKELKARKSLIKDHKVDRARSRPVMAWVPKKCLDPYANEDSFKRLQSIYTWVLQIMKMELEPMVDLKNPRRVSNFEERIRGMHIFVGNITYMVDFLILDDISSVIDPFLSQVVLGKQFVKVSNMTYDSSLGIVKFTNGVDAAAYKIPHKIEQF
nr:MAK10-like protein [Tanacetum cinerariifolium]